MSPESSADRVIDRFYELEDADPRQCAHGMMLVGSVLYQITVDSVSRSGKTVQFHCNGESGSAKRDNVGEWVTENEPHYPIRFVRPSSAA